MHPVCARYKTSTFPRIWHLNLFTYTCVREQCRRVFFSASSQTDFLFTLFKINLCNNAILRKKKRFHMRVLRYSHGAERLRMHNIYSNLNNIKTFTPLWLNKCPRLKLRLSVSLLWHVFLMKCPKFTWSACHHFFSFVFCRPSNGSQQRIKVSNCLQNIFNNNSNNCFLSWFKYRSERW